ncbi:MAG: ANTAR domain-containing protein [Nocardioides sp.]
MTPRTPFARLHDDPEFRADPSGMVVLDRDLVIRAANDAVLDATGRVAADVLDLPVFEAYPGNPDGGDGNTEAVFHEAFERVLSTGRPGHLLVQRYDVVDQREAGRYVPRYWSPRQEPLLDGETVVGVVSRVVAVSAPEGAALELLDRWRAELAETGGEDEPAVGLAEALVWGIHQLGALHRENQQLREALDSRATIDQAKGILMAQRGVDPEAAFRLLVRMSNDSNVRLADVARALVYRSGGA